MSTLFIQHQIAIALTTSCVSDIISKFEPLYKILKTIQFPWRFCGYAAFFLIIVLVVTIQNIDNKIILAIMGVLYFIPAMSCVVSGINDEPTFLESREINQGALLKVDYLELDMDTNAMITNKDVIVTDDDVIISNYTRKGMNISFDFECGGGIQQTLVLPLYYFDGYACTIDGINQNIECNYQRLITITIPVDSNSGHIEVNYEG